MVITGIYSSLWFFLHPPGNTEPSRAPGHQRIKGMCDLGKTKQIVPLGKPVLTITLIVNFQGEKRGGDERTDDRKKADCS